MGVYMIAGSLQEVLDQMKKDKEEFDRGYRDFIKENEMTPYEQGRAAAQRDMLEQQQYWFPERYRISYQGIFQPFKII